MKQFEKTLSFIVPAYNSESTLERCLDSFLVPHLFKRMEIIIVNDGSTDGTKMIAQSYANRYSCFHLINKDNAGHGSVINSTVNIINGKYFKVIDSDDWVKTENLTKFIDALETTEADSVFTHFRTIDSRNEHIRMYSITGIVFGKTYLFDDYWSNKQNVFQVCCFHGITYNTDFYRTCNIKLSEGISYEDQEYSTLPFAHIQTVVPLDIFLYEYSVGTPDQSMSDANQVKRLNQREKVLWKLLDSTPPNLVEAVADYFIFKNREFLLAYFKAALIINPDKSEGRQMVRELRNSLKERNALLLKESRGHYIMCLAISYLGKFGNTLMDLRRIEIFRKLAIYMRGGGKNSRR